MPEREQNDRRASTNRQPKRFVTDAARREFARRDVPRQEGETENGAPLPELPEHEPTGERGGRYGDGWW